MWSGWLRGKISCYFPTVIFVFSNINTIIGLDEEALADPDYEEPSTFEYIRGFFKLVILLVLPFLSFILLKRNKDKINTEDFDGKYGTLYLNMNK